jgi:hypothetical protein
MPRMGSTGSHRASGREKTSVQKMGGEVVGSGDAVLRISRELTSVIETDEDGLNWHFPRLGLCF